jgi:hypothetical protein
MSSQFSLSRAMSTEEGVYGLVLVSGLIAASGSAGASAWKTLVFTLVTVAVFGLAHVYAGAVAAHGADTPEGVPMSIGAATREAVVKSRGMLASTLLPVVPLLLGSLGLIRDATATWAALWVCVAALAGLGYIAYRRKGAKLHVRLLGALSTASFGAVIILAKAIITH